MSTIYVFDQELSAGSATLQPTDKILVHEASTSTKKYLTGASPGSPCNAGGLRRLAATSNQANGGRRSTDRSMIRYAWMWPQPALRKAAYSSGWRSTIYVMTAPSSAREAP